MKPACPEKRRIPPKTSATPIHSPVETPIRLTKRSMNGTKTTAVPVRKAERGELMVVNPMAWTR